MQSREQAAESRLAGFLYVVANEADASGRTLVRVVRLWTPEDLEIPAPPNGGSREFLGGTSSKNWFGWPAIEVNKKHNAVVVYAISGPDYYPSIRYNAWIHDEPKLRSGRILKDGQSATINGAATRWGDVAGASVDFVQGQEADGIWIVHEYTDKNGSPQLWVGKIFGQNYADLHPLDLNLAKKRSLRAATSRSPGTIVNRGDAARTPLRPRSCLSGVTESLSMSPRSPWRRQTRAAVARQATLLPAVTVPPGIYSLRLIADAKDAVEEYSEENNEATASIEVRGTTPPSAASPTGTASPTRTSASTVRDAAPDLVIDALTTTRVTVANRAGGGGEFEVTVTGMARFRSRGLAAGAPATRRFASPCSRTVNRLTANRRREEASGRVRRVQQHEDVEC